MNNAIQYKGEWISKNSEAFKLWTEKKFSELDALMAKVHKDAVKRGEFRA